jgi:uncharacterized protein
VQLKLLWELQEMDLAIAALNKRIGEARALSGIEEITKALDDLKETYSDQEFRFREDAKKLKKHEMDIQKIVDDRKELRDSLYSGKVKNAKELEQIQRKSDLLEIEKKKLEDKSIALMESVEEQEIQLEQTEKEIARKEQEIKEKEDQLAADLEQFNLELSRLEIARFKQAEKVDSQYINRYSRMAEKFQGRPLARVADDICGGCRVFISSGLRGRLYNPDLIVYCENCGRLLVKLDDQ